MVLSTIASTTSTVSVSTSGTVTVDNTNKTGIAVKVNGVGQGTQLQVALNKVNAPTEGQGQVALSGGGQVKYYDIKVTGNVTQGTTTTVCITDPSVTPSSQMADWKGNGWVVLASTVNGDQICATVPLADLGGTNFAVGTGFVAAPITSSTTGGQGGGIPEYPFELWAAIFMTAVILVSFLAARRHAFGK